jgi:hypothetical protein
VGDQNLIDATGAKELPGMGHGHRPAAAARRREGKKRTKASVKLVPYILGAAIARPPPHK